MASLKSIVKRSLITLGLPPHKLPYFPPPLVDPYIVDPELCREYDHIAMRTVVDRKRVAMLKQFIHSVSGLSGDVAEVGVYRGGTAWLFAKQLAPTGKMLHLFDTFEGMPETSPDKDLHKAGHFNDTSLQGVQLLLKDYPNVKFYPGFFPETAPPIDKKIFCFVHIDLDIYQSIYDSCAFFYSRLVPNGLMVFDDYGFLSCPGAKQAVDEFYSDKPESPIYLPTGQAFVVKR